tara:strand:- start:196 stop:801 length:606 start_codon:yes stop_codon:yes gene_type:complete
MAYKKKNRGAALIVIQTGNELNFTGNYFNKWVHHQVNLDEKKTKIVTGTYKYEDMDKPVVWRDNWLQHRYINFKQTVDNQLWFIDFNANGYEVSFTKHINGIDIGDDYWNIKKCQFLGKVVSNFNSYLKQNKNNAIVLHPEDKGVNAKRYIVKPEVLVSCIKAVNEEFPYTPRSREESYEYAQNVFEVTQGREPELDDLPF